MRRRETDPVVVEDPAVPDRDTTLSCLIAAIPMDNPYCSCELARDRM